MSLLSPENAPKSPVFGHETPQIEQKAGKTGQNTRETGPLETLESINVDSEIASLYRDAKHLLSEVSASADTPANQKAQVLNSVISLIERISRLRTDLYSAERMRRMEQTLIRVLRGFPQLQEEFLEAYERALSTSDV